MREEGALKWHYDDLEPVCEADGEPGVGGDYLVRLACIADHNPDNVQSSAVSCP